jgi:hypothetical protein
MALVRRQMSQGVDRARGSGRSFNDRLTDRVRSQAKSAPSGGRQSVQPTLPFLTTWMPPEANAMFANTLDKNRIDRAARPNPYRVIPASIDRGIEPGS